MIKSSLKYLLILTIGGVIPAAHLNADTTQSNYSKMHSSHHGEHMSISGEMGKHVHDEVNMPGLQGKNTTSQEVSDLKRIFTFHESINRKVSNIERGIITVTEAEDDKLRQSIVTHVAMMVTRLQEGNNPEVIIQSPTLDSLFKFYDEIDTEIELTDLGIKVSQISINPLVVKLLQTHAAEVSDMSERGMKAVHERMAKGHH
ncbi:MAG: hypothetical protein ISQ20_01315 [Alphaproteobacteria bacterium]|nr:hypothetical protein [Alphaproteobacteria bacterium]